MFLSSFKLLLIEHSMRVTYTKQLAATYKALIIKSSTTPLGTILKLSLKSLRGLTFVLRYDTTNNMSSLIDIAVVDYVKGFGRFSINYLFYSSCYASRLQLCTFTNETTSVPSLLLSGFLSHAAFPSSNWLEREVWDLFGIYFVGHADLRRILTDYGFSGHPLRKDFPLTGFYELVYNDTEGRLVFAPVELAQELRIFHL